MKKRNTLLALLSICVVSLFGQGNTPAATIDSLQHVIDTTHQGDTARLSALCQLAFMQQSTPKSMELSNIVLKEANSPKHDQYICRSAYYAAIYCYNSHLNDSVTYYANIIKPAAERVENWGIYFETIKLQISLYALDENFELAINEAKIMREKAIELNYLNGIMNANLSLATAYMATGRWDEGTEILKETQGMLDESENIPTKLSVLSLLIPVSKITKDYDNLLAYNMELERLINEHIEKVGVPKSTYNNVFLFSEVYYAVYHMAIQQYEEAYKHLLNAKAIFSPNSFYAYKVIYYDAWADYYDGKKEYDKALEYTDTELSMLMELMPKDYYKMLSKKADILTRTGRYEEALPLYLESAMARDSIAYAIANKQMDQIYQIYNINQLQIENEKIESSRQKAILIIISITLFIITLFAIRGFIVRRRLKISEREMREAAQSAEEINEIKNRFLSNMSYNIRTPLNSVVGFSQLIAADPDMEESMRKEYTLIIQQKSEELMVIVNNVLDLSRLESGMMKFNIQEYDVSVLCQESIFAAKSENDKRIEVKFEPLQEEAYITSDLSRLGKVITNTLTYPSGYNGEEKRVITLNLQTENKEVRFTITNSPLCDPNVSNQETNIRNEINRLFITHFKGTYEVKPEAVVFTYPIN